jgi:hypothetical protein
MEANCTTAVLKKPNIYRKNFKAHNTVTLLSLIKFETRKDEALAGLIIIGPKQNKNDDWRCGGSNPVPLACKASALPIEVQPHVYW